MVLHQNSSDDDVDDADGRTSCESTDASTNCSMVNGGGGDFSGVVSVVVVAVVVVDRIDRSCSVVAVVGNTFQ